MLSRILNAPIPDSYFKLFARALNSAEVCGPAILADVGETDNPDMIGEVADLLIRKENTDRVHNHSRLYNQICSFRGCEKNDGSI